MQFTPIFIVSHASDYQSAGREGQSMGCLWTWLRHKQGMPQIPHSLPISSQFHVGKNQGSLWPFWSPEKATKRKSFEGSSPEHRGVAVSCREVWSLIEMQRKRTARKEERTMCGTPTNPYQVCSATSPHSDASYHVPSPSHCGTMWCHAELPKWTRSLDNSWSKSPGRSLASLKSRVGKGQSHSKPIDVINYNHIITILLPYYYHSITILLPYYYYI